MGARTPSIGCLDQLVLARLRLAGSLGLTILLLFGCVTAGVETGLYVVRPSDGVPGWVGAPAGIPVWSPIADTVAWGNDDGVFLAELDERTPTRLIDAPVVGRPAWSPDGTAIAVIDRNLASLVVINVDSGKVRFDEPIADESAGYEARLLVTFGGPSWAPDGTRLAFVCSDGSGDEICVIQADGTGRRQVTKLEPLEVTPGSAIESSVPAASNAGPPAWSPDGDFLAVAAYPEQRGAPRGVFIVDLKEGAAKRISELVPNSAIGWFPDGGSVYFSVVQSGRSDVLQVSTNGLVEQVVTAALAAGARNPALSSDGLQFAVESARSIIVLRQRDGVQEFAVEGLRATYPSWSLDGFAIGFAAVPDPIASYN